MRLGFFRDKSLKIREERSRAVGKKSGTRRRRSNCLNYTALLGFLFPQESAQRILHSAAGLPAGHLAATQDALQRAAG
jgi:hypothetical protein